MDVAIFCSRSGSASHFLASRSTRDVAASWRQRLEDRIEALDGFFRTTDHHAISALQSPDAAARAHVHVVHALGGANSGAANVIFEIRIAAVDDSVARLHASDESLHRLFRGIACWDHDPDRARSGQLANQVVKRRRGPRPFAGDTLYGIGAQIGHHHRVTAAHQAPRHVGAHAPQTYHSQLHSCSFSFGSDGPEARPHTTLVGFGKIFYKSYYKTCFTSSASLPSPAFTSLPRCTRSARRLRSART